MTGKWNIIAGSHGCLIGRYGGFTTDYTILKYPFNKGSSDVTINNNLIGEEQFFYALLCVRLYARYIVGLSFGTYARGFV
jgi:hypothetical protein